jgi:hypothetical protein
VATPPVRPDRAERLDLRAGLQRQQRSQRHRRQHQIKQVGAQASSDFSFMPGGDYSAQVGSQTVPVKLAATLLHPGQQRSGNPQLIEEPPFKNKQKSLVRVQNLSDKH